MVGWGKGGRETKMRKETEKNLEHRKNRQHPSKEIKESHCVFFLYVAINITFKFFYFHMWFVYMCTI